MNVKTFNEPFLKNLKLFPKPEEEKVLSAPLFYHEDGSEHWEPSDENDYAWDKDDFVILPFPIVRLFLKSTDTSGTCTTTAGLIVINLSAITHGAQKGMVIYGNIIDQFQDGKLVRKNLIQDLMFQMIRRINPANPEKHAVFVQAMDQKSRKALDISKDEELKAAVQERVNYFWELIQKFSIDVMNPANHIASVRPGAKGKSVQWQKARTHYVILNRNHPANRVGATGKIATDEKRQLNRIAHTRRAHFRILRSERYKKMKGQRLFIKSVWVGPKEWEDTQGNYYLIHPKNQ